mgnify:CR=1 FL=1
MESDAFGVLPYLVKVEYNSWVPFLDLSTELLFSSSVETLGEGLNLGEPVNEEYVELKFGCLATGSLLDLEPFLSSVGSYFSVFLRYLALSFEAGLEEKSIFEDSFLGELKLKAEGLAYVLDDSLVDRET